MTLFGITTRRPTFNEFTAAVVMAVGLWLLGLAVMLRAGETIEPFDAGGLLLVLTWGCVAVRMGIRPDRGWRHLAVNACVSAVLLGAYGSVFSMVA